MKAHGAVSITSSPVEVGAEGLIKFRAAAGFGPIIGCERARELFSGSDRFFFRRPIARRSVAAGIYYYRLEAAGFSATRSMLLLK